MWTTLPSSATILGWALAPLNHISRSFWLLLCYRGTKVLRPFSLEDFFCEGTLPLFHCRWELTGLGHSIKFLVLFFSLTSIFCISFYPTHFSHYKPPHQSLIITILQIQYLESVLSWNYLHQRNQFITFRFNSGKFLGQGQKAARLLAKISQEWPMTSRPVPNVVPLQALLIWASTLHMSFNTAFLLLRWPIKLFLQCSATFLVQHFKVSHSSKRQQA